MSDIVHELRDRGSWRGLPAPDRVLLEAADEIERLRGIEHFVSDASQQERDGLRAEIERLTAVLRYIIEIDDPTEAPILARRALEPKP